MEFALDFTIEGWSDVTEGGFMEPLFWIADMSPLPFVIGGGVLLLVICGMFFSVAVLLFGSIKRKRRRPKEPEDKR